MQYPDDPVDPVYLDYNATTPMQPQVLEAMQPWLGALWGNPSSSHAYGQRAAAAVADARAAVATLVGAQPEEIVFTGGGTEADNLALRGPAVLHKRIVVSAVEHPAVQLPSLRLVDEGWTRTVLPVEATGRVALDRARTLLAEPAGLLSVILAQNETGVIQPVAELAAMARQADANVVVHTDAAQAVGKIDVDVTQLGVDLLTIVSHKLYGPNGIGALWVRPGLSLAPLTLGGGQEGGRRPGTEPVALIVGFGAACTMAARDTVDEPRRQAQLREQLWAGLSRALPAVVRTGDGVATLPNTLHVRFEGCVGAEILAAAPAVAAATGSACHSDDAAPSGVLGAMGVSVGSARGSVRLSLGRRTTPQDVDRAIEALVNAVQNG